MKVKLSMKKNIISIVVVLGVLVALALAGKTTRANLPEPVQPVSATQASLSAAVTSYDFGTISMKNNQVEYSFLVANETSADLTLSKVTTSCMCTEAYIVNGLNKKGPFGMPGHGGLVPKANEVIKKGETRLISVVFDPNAHGPAGVGKIERLIQLETDGGEVLDLTIKAIVTP